MSLIRPLARWVHRKLTGVLGYDCAGKPLRAGDKVVLLPPTNPNAYIREGFRGVLEVVRVEPDQVQYPGKLELVNEIGDAGCALPCDLRKLGDEEAGDWSELSESTGWTPNEVKHKEETHHESP